MTDNEIARLFGIDHPVVLGPFGGMSSVELTRRVSELGGLGSYGLYGYDADRIHTTVAALRARTDRPFALNLWVPTGRFRTPAQRLDEPELQSLWAGRSASLATSDDADDEFRDLVAALP